MSSSLVHFVPIVTTILTVPFAVEIFRRYRSHPDRVHLLWWAAGVAIYGVGTLTESITSLIGWREPVFRAWYISGALMGGAPLAQGTAYLLLPRRRAHALTALLVTTIAWPWVRRFSPFINLYAVVFLIGGAILSAVRFSGHPATRHRVHANVLIAVGAILPGIGGTATRFGYTEVLYVTELIGLLLIWTGYRLSVTPSVAQPSRATGLLRS
jgi:hypothetical protein